MESHGQPRYIPNARCDVEKSVRFFTITKPVCREECFVTDDVRYELGKWCFEARGWLGHIPYGSRISSRRTFTAEEHPVVFYVLLAIHGECVLLGVFMTFSHIRSALLVARFREEEQRAEENRKAEQRNKHRKLQPMTDEQRNRLVCRARKRRLDEGRAKNDPRQ